MSLGYVIIESDGGRLEITRISLADSRIIFHCQGFFEYREPQEIMGRCTAYAPDDTVILSWFAFCAVGGVVKGALWMDMPVMTFTVTQHEELDWERHA